MDTPTEKPPLVPLIAFVDHAQILAMFVSRSLLQWSGLKLPEEVEAAVDVCLQGFNVIDHDAAPIAKERDDYLRKYAEVLGQLNSLLRWMHDESVRVQGVLHEEGHPVGDG